MVDVFVIERQDITAGMAVRQSGGFRFHSSDDLFGPIDTRKFRGLRELKTDVTRVAAERSL